MTLTEGMTYGCIPFTFNNYGAASDIIDDGINGCLINAFDVKHYSKRLSELMINKEERIRMSRAAVEKVKFSLQRMLQMNGRSCFYLFKKHTSTSTLINKSNIHKHQ